MKKNLFSLMILYGSLMNAQTYSNGNLSTGNMTSNGVAAPAGYTWSEIQGANTTLGVSGYEGGTADFRLADDFIIPVGESWSVTKIDVFGYQTGSAAFPIDHLTIQILDGPPNTTPAVVYGDLTTNVLNVAGSGDALMYRTAPTAGTTRKIWKIQGNVVKTLGQGTYWLNYQVHAINDGAVFFPVVTNVGVSAEPGANAQQFSTTWNPLVDTGSGNAQALPFVITYTVLGTNETNQFDSRVIVYPNPTADTFKLSVPAESLGAKTEVTIYDQSGKKVKSYPLSDSYDVRDLTNGLYLIKINDGQNIKTTKLIKK